MDSGANGGVTGEDILILNIIEHSKGDIFGVSDNMVLDLTLCQGASVITMEGCREIVMQTWERGDPSTPWHN
jgi:hypothetical protein